MVATVGLRSIVGHFAMPLYDGSRYYGNQSICLSQSTQNTSRDEKTRSLFSQHGPLNVHIAPCAPSLVAPLGEFEARRSLCATEGQRHATH